MAEQGATADLHRVPRQAGVSALLGEIVVDLAVFIAMVATALVWPVEFALDLIGVRS